MYNQAPSLPRDRIQPTVNRFPRSPFSRLFQRVTLVYGDEPVLSELDGMAILEAPVVVTERRHANEAIQTNRC